MHKIFLLFLTLLCFDFHASSQEFQNGSRWISASSGLRMRDQPNLNGKKLDVIPYGERVNWVAENEETVFLAGTSGKWTKVKWEGKDGWVYGGFLSSMHPEKATLNTDVLSTFYSDKWGEKLSLIRVELDGRGFTLRKDGSINLGDYEYDVTTVHRYEKGISVSINGGHEWGSTTYEFDTKVYTIEEIFRLASTFYSEKYKQYLNTENDQLALPTSTENSSREDTDGYTIGNFQSEIIDGSFESFRIEEEEGCMVWWFFLIDEGFIRFGEGAGC